MNIELYNMVKRSIITAGVCPDGRAGRPCESCMAESVTHMLEDNFNLDRLDRKDLGLHES